MYCLQIQLIAIVEIDNIALSFKINIFVCARVGGDIAAVDSVSAVVSHHTIKHFIFYVR